MILRDLDPQFLYFLDKKDLKNVSILSKYHHRLTAKYTLPLCYNLLKHHGYEIFIYENTISLLKDCECISFLKSEKPDKLIKNLLNKIK